MSLVAVFVHAQTPPAPAFAAESFVIEHYDTRYVMAADGTGVLERSAAVRVQSEAALRQFSVIDIGFASSSQKVEIVYARARRPDGTVVETPPAEAIEQPEAVTREAPFYSDLKETQLPVKSLRVGDTLEWKARIIRTKPEAPNNFWGGETFTTAAVTLNETIELRYPKAVSVNVWTNPKVTAKPAESNEGTDHIVRWQTNNLKPTTGPEAEAAKAAKKKKLLTADEEFDQQHGELPSVAWTTFRSWAAVGEWYRSLESGRTAPDADIKAKVAELTAGKTTEEERVRAVYGFVAPQIRYIGVAFGVGRYQPHQASEVLGNQYGDCKDKHTLLAAMLTTLGLHPDAVLIGEGIRFNEAVPSPAAFNHVITRVPVDGKAIWLDATAEVAPYRMLAYDLRDEQALVVPEAAASAPEIERTPAEPPFPSSDMWKAVGSLDKEGVSTSRITYATRGDEELLFREVLRQVPPANYEELIQKISESMGYGGTASHASFSRPEDTAEPLTWSYDYKREQGGDWEHFKIVPQTKYNGLPILDEKEPPVASIQLGFPRTETSSAEMKLPAGWGVELPEAIHAKSAFATLDETFRFEKGVVYTSLKVVVLKKELPATEWKSYKTWTEEAGLTKMLYIQLTHTGSDQAATGATERQDAGKLVDRANDALRKGDFKTAQELLDEAKSINPTQQNLAGDYGALNYDRGNWTEAILNYQKEVALHPAQVWVYDPMARAQVLTNHRDEAIQTLRTWVKAAPENPAASVALVNLLLEVPDTAAAVEAANKGIAALPESKRNDSFLRFALAKAQVAAGDPASGSATFVALLHDSNDALMMNNAAYELSKTGNELPLAERTSRLVLSRLGGESTTWTLDESPAVLRSKTSLIIASWDTLGFILFREARYDEALDFIRAAWVNSQHTEIGEHLGDIYDKLGNHQEAYKTYALTLATIPGYNALGVRTAPGPDVKRLHDKMDAQKQAGAKADKLDAQTALVRLRTVSLGPANGHDGAAEYILLLSRDRVEKAQATGEHTVNGGVDVIRKMDVKNFTPIGVEVRLARAAILNCHANACDLVFEP